MGPARLGVSTVLETSHIGPTNEKSQQKQLQLNVKERSWNFRMFLKTKQLFRLLLNYTLISLICRRLEEEDDDKIEEMIDDISTNEMFGSSILSNGDGDN